MDPREQYVRARAQSIGLNPDLAVSVWQQESGKSEDTGLKGAALSRGRGNAIGPWQVVPYYHPQFPVNGSFEEQTDYGLNYLKEVGPARYYGTGQAPPGDPTTDEYVNQVMNRVPGAGDTIPASAIAGDPSVYSGSIAPVSALPPGGSPMYPQLTPPPAPPPMAQMPQLSPFQQAMSDPMLMTGLSMLTGAVSGQPFGAALQGGMMGGYGNALAMQQLQQKQLDRDYSHKQALWEFQNQQARDQFKYQQSLDEKKREVEWIDDVPYRIASDGSIKRVPIAGAPKPPGASASLSSPDLVEDVAAGLLEPKDAIKLEETRKRETEAAVKGARKEYKGDVAGPAFRLQVWDEVKEMNPASKNAIEDQRLAKAWAKAVLPRESVMAGDTNELSAAGENVVSNFMNYWTGGTGSLPEDKKRKLLQDIRTLAQGAQDTSVQTWGNAQSAAMRNTLIPQGRMDDVVGRLPKLFEPSSQEWMQGGPVAPVAAPPAGIPATATRTVDPETNEPVWYDAATGKWYKEG